MSGIDLRVHVSFLVLGTLFAAAAPEPGVTSALTNVVWLVVIFACVVVHELAHCFVAELVARRSKRSFCSRSAESRDCATFPSPHETSSLSPSSDPITSIGLDVVAAVLCLATGRSLLPFGFAADALLARLAWLNLMLGVFNREARIQAPGISVWAGSSAFVAGPMNRAA